MGRVDTFELRENRAGRIVVRLLDAGALPADATANAASSYKFRLVGPHSTRTCAQSGALSINVAGTNGRCTLDDERTPGEWRLEFNGEGRFEYRAVVTME